MNRHKLGKINLKQLNSIYTYLMVLSRTQDACTENSCSAEKKVLHRHFWKFLKNVCEKNHFK